MELSGGRYFYIDVFWVVNFIRSCVELGRSGRGIIRRFEKFMSIVRFSKYIDRPLGVAAGCAPYSLLDYGARRGLS